MQLSFLFSLNFSQLIHCFNFVNRWMACMISLFDACLRHLIQYNRTVVRDQGHAVLFMLKQRKFQFINTKEKNRRKKKYTVQLEIQGEVQIVVMVLSMQVHRAWDRNDSNYFALFQGQPSQLRVSIFYTIDVYCTVFEPKGSFLFLVAYGYVRVICFPTFLFFASQLILVWFSYQNFRCLIVIVYYNLNSLFFLSKTGKLKKFV